MPREATCGDVRQAEPRVWGGHPADAREREFQARAHGVALDRGDDRRAAIRDGVDHELEGASRLPGPLVEEILAMEDDGMDVAAAIQFAQGLGEQALLLRVPTTRRGPFHVKGRDGAA